ncbi:carbohydrate porin [Acinetobacter lactucae]|nr:carbohydrate porin [Acinetobacter lactucae]
MTHVVIDSSILEKSDQYFQKYSNNINPSRASTKPKIQSFLGMLGLIITGNFLTFSSIGTAQAGDISTESQALTSATSPQTPNCLKYDNIRPRSSTTPWPSNCATMDPELGGLREKLYNNGWNFRSYAMLGAMYDVGKQNEEQGAQTYSGQEALLHGNIWLSFLYDLSRLGFNNGATFTFDISTGAASWNEFLPSKTYISELSFFTPFANDRAELKFGMVRAEREFYGVFSGSNVGASALKAESAINIQTGMPTREPSPYLGLTVYDKNHKLYGKAAIAQSMSPDGLLANGKFKEHLFSDVPDAKPLYVTELGYRGRADLGEKSHWLRAGAIYNTSKYQLYDGTGGKDKNYAFYAQSDIQLNQTSEQIPQLGWYLNFRTNYAPADRNIYNGDVGFSFYKIGPFPSRPADLFSVGVARNWFSDDFRNQLSLAGQATEEYQTTFSTSYAYAVAQGFYMNIGIAHTDNPTLTPKQKPATVASLMLTMAF